jgi:uncharacterized membrane protein (Fun14 family)
MKNRFIMGIAIGLVVGLLIGFVIKHFWSLLFLAIAISILAAASRTTRQKFFPPRAAGR